MLLIIKIKNKNKKLWISVKTNKINYSLDYEDVELGVDYEFEYIEQFLWYSDYFYINGREIVSKGNGEVTFKSIR